jgi:N-terminal domain of galactosyltransferase
MRGTVAVILPLFGSHRAAQTLPAVCAAWLAQDVPCEVVVAAAGGFAVPDGVRLVACEPDARSPGPLRNRAAAAADAPVLYLGDADVVPLGRDFLSRALHLRGAGAGAGVVVQPWMYRLVGADDLVGVPQWQQPGRGKVCHVRGGTDGRLVALPGEVFRWDDDVLLVEPPPEAVYPDDSPELLYRAPFHWGGTLVGHDLFDAVGGYCERYVGWGCEDDDLHAKLAGRATVHRAWQVARTLKCVHFEHPRAYHGPELLANKEILRARRASGPDAMIAEDRRVAPIPVAGR